MMKRKIELSTTLSGRWRIVAAEEKMDRNGTKYLTDECGNIFVPTSNEDGKPIELVMERK
jgi:hypothetical protein